MPLGNLTSQLFANAYLDGFDHFVKEELRYRYYIRYTDDAVIVGPKEAELHGLIDPILEWLWSERRLILHPKKVEVRKLSQGIDFLGYVTLPHYRVLRTRTKRRMFKRVDKKNLPSYLGMLGHADGHGLSQRLQRVARG